MFSHRSRAFVAAVAIVIALAGVVFTPAQPASAAASYSFSGTLNGYVTISVNLPANETFTFALDCPGNQIDPVVLVFDPSGTYLGGDDDSGPTTCQGFRSSVVTLTTTDAGTYSVEAYCYSLCTGAYLLTINGGVGFSGRGIPDGFVLREITCTVAVFDAPGGKPVGDNRILQGQTWYVDPKGSKTTAGESWTEIFVSGSTNGWIPSRCVSK